MVYIVTLVLPCNSVYLLRGWIPYPTRPQVLGAAGMDPAGAGAGALGAEAALHPPHPHRTCPLARSWRRPPLRPRSHEPERLQLR